MLILSIDVYIGLNIINLIMLFKWDYEFKYLSLEAMFFYGKHYNNIKDFFLFNRTEECYPSVISDIVLDGKDIERINLDLKKKK